MSPDGLGQVITHTHSHTDTNTHRTIVKMLLFKKKRMMGYSGKFLMGNRVSYLLYL